MSARLLPSGAHHEPIAWRHRNIHSSSSPTDAYFPQNEFTGSPVATPVSNAQAPADAAQTIVRQQQRIHELEHEVERATHQRYREGLAAGEAAGAQQAAQKLEPVLQRLARTVEELAALRRRVRAGAEEDAVRLAVAVAGKILHREITVDSESLLGLIKAAFQRIDAREVHRLRVHPEDAPAIQRAFSSSGFPARFEISPDPALERGAAIFETSRGNLDASISTQLQEIERGFIDIVRRDHSAPHHSDI